MISLALYPIYIPGVVEPHYTLQKGFEDVFFPCRTFDWLARKNERSLYDAQLEFLNYLILNKPEYTFMQLQNPVNMSVEMIRQMAKHTKIIQWSGDIRTNKEWYNWFEAIGKEIHLTLFSNMTDVEIMRERGVKADYLQVAVDTGWYYSDGREKSGPKIVFSAHNYGSFPLSKYRLDAAEALKKEFGNDFKLYGGGWPAHFKATVSNCHEEAEAYRNAEIGISISNFDFKNYHSDRLLRIMACDCLPLSHNYQGVYEDYEVRTEIEVFIDIPDLIQKCHFYLENKKYAKRVRSSALAVIQDRFTWKKFAEGLQDLIYKYE